MKQQKERPQHIRSSIVAGVRRKKKNNNNTKAERRQFRPVR